MVGQEKLGNGKAKLKKISSRKNKKKSIISNSNHFKFMYVQDIYSLRKGEVYDIFI